MHAEAAEITQALGDVRLGKTDAPNKLMDLVYTRLCVIAHGVFSGERPNHTLQPTALVHEAYVRLFSGAGAELDWHDRRHFFAVAARQMRRVLLDHGKHLGASKRKGLKVSFEPDLHGGPGDPHEFDDVHELLERFDKTDQESARVVEMKFFAGMTDEEVAAELGCSHTTVRRKWNFAKAWLVKRMAAPASIQTHR